MLKTTEFMRRLLLAFVATCFGGNVHASAPGDSAKPVVTTPVAGDITQRRLMNADSQPGEWLTGGRNYQQNYFSPLADIDKKNVRKLGFAWAYDVDSARLAATPIVVDGIMFTSGNKGAVYALDAKTGAQRWAFSPTVDPEIFRKHCCGGINRGVAVWRGKVYVASLDGYLYALNADTGALAWKADTVIDRSRAYTSTGAPYIANSLVVIGNSGAEFDARGYITAYDSATGRQAWRFFTVPGDPKRGFEHPELEMAAKTWDPNSLWEVGLGGTVWDGMAYDPKLNLLYVGTGNGTPYPRKLRSPAGGDNLFLACILAINPDTGRLVWHYQTVPGENWDFTATQKLVLADLTLDGRQRRVIMQAPKNGFFYVLDRTTGELLSAKPFAKVNWASHIDMQTGRPVETGLADYSEGPKLMYPNGAHGAHSWQPMAFNPNTGLVYIPVVERPSAIGMSAEPFEYKKSQTNLGARWLPTESLSNGQDTRGRLFLRAWDPARQRLAWEVETTGAEPMNTADSGGVMTTAADLVFQGRKDGYLYIFDARTGTELHKIDVGTGMSAAPMTYRVGREQFVAVMASPPLSSKLNSEGRIVAFKVGGGATPRRPQMERSDSSLPPPMSIGSNPAEIALGQKLFERNCAVCHASGEIAPDLTNMSQQSHSEFNDIVLNGRRVNKGMGNFSAILSHADAEAIHAYIKDAAWKNYKVRQGE